MTEWFFVSLLTLTIQHTTFPKATLFFEIKNRPQSPKIRDSLRIKTTVFIILCRGGGFNRKPPELQASADNVVHVATPIFHLRLRYYLSLNPLLKISSSNFASPFYRLPNTPPITPITPRSITPISSPLFPSSSPTPASYPPSIQI